MRSTPQHTLNQIRLVCNDSDRKGLHVKSTLDNTYKLDGHTDESISFADDDLIVLKNCLERPCELLLESIRLPEGRRAIFRPSRQQSFALTDKAVSITRSERELTLGPGESCSLHSSCWLPQGGAGKVFPV